MPERLDVTGLQIAADSSIAAHFQRLMKLDGQIVATAHNTNTALIRHLESVDVEGALALKGQGTVVFHLQIPDEPVPCSHEHALAPRRHIHGDVIDIARLEDGRPGVAIARDLQAAVNGDPGAGQLAAPRDDHLVRVEASRPRYAAIVVIPDRQLPDIEGRAIEVEHRSFSKREGVEAIGLPRFQRRHATVSTP